MSILSVGIDCYKNSVKLTITISIPYSDVSQAAKVILISGKLKARTLLNRVYVYLFDQNKSSISLISWESYNVLVDNVSVYTNKCELINQLTKFLCCTQPITAMVGHSWLERGYLFCQAVSVSFVSSGS